MTEFLRSWKILHTTSLISTFTFLGKSQLLECSILSDSAFYCESFIPCMLFNCNNCRQLFSSRKYLDLAPNCACPASDRVPYVYVGEFTRKSLVRMNFLISIHYRTQEKLNITENPSFSFSRSSCCHRVVFKANKPEPGASILARDRERARQRCEYGTRLKYH